MQIKSGTTYIKFFKVTSDETPVSGLTNLDFMKSVFYESTVSSITATVFEVNSFNAPGIYRFQFVPTQSGWWGYEVTCPGFEVSPQVLGTFQATGHDIDEVFSVLTSTPPGGSILVDTDYGGVDNLRYTGLQGTGVADADVRAYLKTDYDQGELGATYIKSSTRTDTNGRLSSPLVLSPGYHYSIVYVVPGRVGDVKEIFVGGDQ